VSVESRPADESFAGGPVRRWTPGEENRRARERTFLRRLAALGSEIGGACQLDPYALSLFADLGEGSTPAQWEREAEP
jgi:hypothetical protein